MLLMTPFPSTIVSQPPVREAQAVSRPTPGAAIGRRRTVDIALDASGRHAAVTSPRGGIVAALDVKRGRVVGEFSLSDTRTGAGTRTAGELVTASVRGLHFITAAR